MGPVGRRVRLEFLDFDLEEKIITPVKQYCVDYVMVSPENENIDTLPLKLLDSDGQKPKPD